MKEKFMRANIYILISILLLGSQLTVNHSETNVYNSPKQNTLPFVVDDAKYSFLDVLEDGDLWGMDLFLYQTKTGTQAIVRFAEGAYLEPEVVAINIDRDQNISFRTLKRYGFKGKITQYHIAGELVYNDGEHYRDITLNRKLVMSEPLFVFENRNAIPIEGEFMNYSFDSKGNVIGLRVKILNNEKGNYIPFIQYANGNFSEILQGDMFNHDKNQISFYIHDSKSKYAKMQGAVFYNSLIGIFTSHDGTSETLTLLRR